jgi:hypothetical protein
MRKILKLLKMPEWLENLLFLCLIALILYSGINDILKGNIDIKTNLRGQPINPFLKVGGGLILFCIFIFYKITTIRRKRFINNSKRT